MFTMASSTPVMYDGHIKPAFNSTYVASFYLDEWMCGVFELPYEFKATSPLKSLSTVFVLDKTSAVFERKVMEIWEKYQADPPKTGMKLILDAAMVAEFTSLNVNNAMTSTETRLLNRFQKLARGNNSIQLMWLGMQRYKATIVIAAVEDDVCTPPKQIMNATKNTPPGAPKRPAKSNYNEERHITKSVVDLLKIAVTRDDQTSATLKALCSTAKLLGVTDVEITVNNYGHFDVLLGQPSRKYTMVETNDGNFAIIEEVNRVVLNETAGHKLICKDKAMEILGNMSRTTPCHDWSSMNADQMQRFTKQLHDVVNRKRKPSEDEDECTSPRRLKFEQETTVSDNNTECIQTMVDFVDEPPFTQLEVATNNDGDDTQSVQSLSDMF